MEVDNHREISSLSKSKSLPLVEEENNIVSSGSDTKQTKPLGWKAMPFILGNETFERLGSFGTMANFTAYLLNEYNVSQVYVAAKFGAWNGVANFLTVIFAFLADAYIGKFVTIVLGSFAALLGMLMVTLTAIVPQLRPPYCTNEERIHGQCIGPNRNHLAFLHVAMFWLAVGGGGIRPCSIPFAVDQFDSRTDEGRKEINSFFNWYYTSFTLVLLITSTVVAYVQTVNWAWGFAIPTVCLFCGLVLLFAGMRIYVLVIPEGSVSSSIVQVFVVAYKKRRHQLPSAGHGIFYDPPLKKTLRSQLPLTASQFRFLNKAAIIEDIDEINQDGMCVKPWRLCSVQQVEEVKCLMNIVPIWASAIISFLPMQIGTFAVGQAMRMDRHLGPKFEIPVPSIFVITLIIMAVFLPIYDRCLVPTLEKFTEQEGGITLLQRIGLGNICSILAMIVAGFVERKRRAFAILHSNLKGDAPISVLWLAPQLILMGFFEILNLLGFIEFYNRQFPDHMRSIGNSLVFLTVSVASYLNSLVVALVHSWTIKHDKHSWLADDINVGKLDYFYFFVAALGLLNFIFFLFVARRYRYKACG